MIGMQSKEIIVTPLGHLHILTHFIQAYTKLFMIVKVQTKKEQRNRGMLQPSNNMYIVWESYTIV